MVVEKVLELKPGPFGGTDRVRKSPELVCWSEFLKENDVLEPSSGRILFSLLERSIVDKVLSFFISKKISPTLCFWLKPQDLTNGMMNA